MIRMLFVCHGRICHKTTSRELADITQEIRNLDDQSQDILLNYPIVYVHTWRDKKGQLHIYVGETNNLVRRTWEHKQSSNPEDISRNWQSEWESGSDIVSFFFGSHHMNKSMSLDLENTLIYLLGKEKEIKIRNGRPNKQGWYSNKKLMPTLLREIWQVLQAEFHLGELKYEDTGKEISLGKENELVFWNKDISEAMDKMITKEKMLSHITEDIAAAIRQESQTEQNLLLEHPVVYMHVLYTGDKWSIYTGEANDLLRRTRQHIGEVETKDKRVGKDNWLELWSQCKSKDKKSYLFVFGHREFNKSMTLDIENRLIQYTIYLGLSRNGRTNEQRKYDNKDKTFHIFEAIVAKLNKFLPDVFKMLDTVKKESVFMASPLLELTDEQKRAKHEITELIDKALKDKKKTLIVVYGSAGTGKTVLASSLFFSLLERKIPSYFMVNQKELFGIYKSQYKVWQLGIGDKDSESVIWWPATYYNQWREKKLEKKPEVIIIDEGHLLSATGQRIKELNGRPLLVPLVQSAPVTVLIFDPKQFVENSKRLEGDWEQITGPSDMAQRFHAQLNTSDVEVKAYDLTEQMRMCCDIETKEWLEALCTPGAKIKTFKGEVIKKETDAIFVQDKKGYEVGVFRSLNAFKKAVAAKKKSMPPVALITMYQRSFSDFGEDKSFAYGFKWHKTGQSKNIPWTMTPVDSLELDVGAYHDIQGLDLNYAGVFLGDLLKYTDENGIAFKISELRGGPTGKDSGKIRSSIIANQLNVLLTRGEKGIYLFADDEKLNEALWRALNE